MSKKKGSQDFQRDSKVNWLRKESLERQNKIGASRNGEWGPRDKFRILVQPQLCFLSDKKRRKLHGGVIGKGRSG